MAKYVQVFIAEGRVGQTCRLITDSPHGPCKRRRAFITGKQQRTRSLSPYLRRVGGGYDYIYPQIPLGEDVLYNVPRRGSNAGHHVLESGCADVAKQMGGEALKSQPVLMPFSSLRRCLYLSMELHTQLGIIAMNAVT